MAICENMPERIETALDTLNEISIWRDGNYRYELRKKSSTTYVLVLTDGQKDVQITGSLPKNIIVTTVISFIRLGVVEGVFRNVKDYAKFD